MIEGDDHFAGQFHSSRAKNPHRGPERPSRGAGQLALRKRAHAELRRRHILWRCIRRAATSERDQ
jgi:hypothetical protein